MKICFNMNMLCLGCKLFTSPAYSSVLITSLQAMSYTITRFINSISI